MGPFRQLAQRGGWGLVPRLHPHTLLQFRNYRLTSMVGTIDFAFNGRRRANQNADHTSCNSALDEFGQPADLAAQPRLGLLPERRPGLGRRNSGRFVTSWKNLEPASDEYFGTLSNPRGLRARGISPQDCLVIKLCGASLSRMRRKEAPHMKIANN